MDKLNADGDALISGNVDDNGIDISASEEDTNSIDGESNSSDHQNESEEGSSVDEEESVSEDESSQDVETLLDEFMNYALGFHSKDITVEGLQERIAHLPIQMIREKVLECNVLHKYLASFKWCQSEGGKRDDNHPPAIIELEVVQYLLELAPDAVNKEEGERYFSGHPRGIGGHPLHLACISADCPVSVIKLLLEKNSMIAKVEWEDDGGGCRHGLPLCCYLERACRHAELGGWQSDPFNDDEVYWDVDTPAFPSVELDYDIVELLVKAYPEALTYSHERSRGNPLNILCKGYDVSVKLAKLLIDEDRDCLKILEGRKYKSPIWSLLQNSLLDKFPDDVFRFLLKCNPSSLEVEEYDQDRKTSDKELIEILRSETPLNIACTNPNMSAETIGLIIDRHPDMVQTEYREDGCLPIHTLCKNKKMGDQSAMAILRLLVNAHPESVKKPAGKCYNPYLGGTGLRLPGSVEGMCAINIAEENKMSFAFVKALLYERAKLSSVPGASVLQVACVYKCKVDTIQKLVEDDKGLLLREDGEGHIALHTARVHQTSLDVMQYVVNGIKSLLSDGEQLSSMPGANVLHIVIECKCPPSIIKKVAQDDPQLLLMADQKGRIPLHLAVRQPEATIHLVRYIVEANHESILKRDELENSPLHVAANFSSLEVVQYLVEGFRSSITDKFSGDMLVERIKLAKEVSELNLRFPNGNGDHPLHKACRRGNFKVVEYLMTKSSVSVTTSNFFGQLPIHLLCDKNKEYKSRRRVQSVEYTECIFKMLTAFPELCNVDVQLVRS